MEERRAFPRFKLGVEIHWKKVSTADEKTAEHISSAKDVSVRGISLVLHSGIATGDVLSINIKLPGRKNIQSKARVIWMNYDARIPKRASTACEGGIEFLEMSDATRKEISDFTSDSFLNLPRK